MKKNEENEKNVIKFFIFLRPKDYSSKFICNISLLTGIKIIIITLFLIAAEKFVQSLYVKSYIYMAIAILKCVLYLISSLYLYLSISSFNDLYADISYFSLFVIIIFQIFQYVIEILLIIFGVIDDYSMLYNLSIVCLNIIFVLTISFYFLWIIFCYTFFLRDDNYDVITGDQEYVPVDGKIEKKTSVKFSVDETNKKI